MKRMTQKTPEGVVLHPPYTIAQALARLAAFEDMQEALAAQRESVEKNLAEMRAAGKEKPPPSINFWPGGSHSSRSWTAFISIPAWTGSRNSCRDRGQNRHRLFVFCRFPADRRV